MSALRAGAAVEAKPQRDGYSWLVLADAARVYEAAAAAASRVSEDGVSVMIHPEECTIERGADGILRWVREDGELVGVCAAADAEALVKAFFGGLPLVASREPRIGSMRYEDEGVEVVWRRASQAERDIGRPRSA
jgi:hypothetical protein